MGFSVNVQREIRRPLEDRLLDKRKIATSGCWEWTGTPADHGYGRMSYKNRVHMVHRLAAHLWLGLDLWDSNVKVCHHCDNPPCFNPEHLYLGTQQSNMDDMTARGRARKKSGKHEYCKKGHRITEENALWERRRCKTCWEEYEEKTRGPDDQRNQKVECIECGRLIRLTGFGGLAAHKEGPGGIWCSGKTATYQATEVEA